MSPDQFWGSTLSEVDAMIRGKVDDWRIQRRCAFLIHRSLVENPVNIYEEIPLPYDWEIEEALGDEMDSLNETAEEAYHRIKKQLEKNKLKVA